MPLLDDLVAERSTATGTGPLTLTAAAGGFRRISTVFGTGSTNKFQYHIRHTNAGEWEVGRGYMSDADTLVRNRVLKSSNSDAAVNFSAGTKEIFVDLPADAGEFILANARLVWNTSGAQINAGKLVSISSYNSTEELEQIILATNATDNAHAAGFLPVAIQNNSAGWMLRAGILEGVDVSGEDDGDPIFLDTAGGFTVGPPTAAVVQYVGNIVESAVAGIVVFQIQEQDARNYEQLWVTGRTYWPRERISNANLIYICNTKHTSSAVFATDAANWDQQSPQTTGAAIEDHPVFETPEVKVYTLQLAAGSAYDIDSLAGKTSSGDVTCTLKIAGVAVTGITAVTFNTTKSTKTATAARRVTGGDEVTLDITGITSPADLAMTFLGTSV